MRQIRPFLAVRCALLALTSTVEAQQPSERLEHQTWHTGITRPYTPRDVAPINLANTNRLDQLMRAGKLYLSLQDAISAALENNLDVEIQRYGAQLAQADLLRARAGGALRGFSTSVASSATSPTSGLTAGTGTSGGTGSSSNATTSFASGTIPSLDPVIQGTIDWGHFTQPQINSFIVGANSVVSTNKDYNVSISQGFLTGTRASLGITNRSQLSNSGRADFNPSTTSALSVQITQPLLQGFGLALNGRNIVIAKNNLRVSDLVFKRQVIATVTTVINYYWDLVTYNEDVKVKQQALALSEKLYSDNKKQVEIGTLAPIEIVRAEAEVAARQQDLLVSQTNVLQQETILKSFISRTGTSSPGLSEANIIPTDRIRIPDTEAIEPIQDLVSRALANRPERAQSQIQIENSKINLKGTRNALLPEIDAFANVRNNALAGQINSIPAPSLNGQPPQLRNPNAVDPFFLGGYGTVLGQLFGRNFPDYSVGLQLNIPLRNRTAQADLVTAELNLRQQQLQSQQTVNNIRVEVQNALIAMQQARARFQAAVKNRVLQEQTLDAEQKKYALGASTIFNVIFAQRDLATAQGNEVVAMNAYIRARTDLDRALGMTLESNNVQLDEAMKGQVSRPPSAPPLVNQPNGSVNP